MSDQVSVKGILCGTFQRVTYEVFGHDGRQWLRIHEGDNAIKARDAFNDPTLRRAYAGRVAWAERTVVETRSLKGANVPVYELVMQMRGEDGEPGPVVKATYSDAITAHCARVEALDMPDCLTANVVDLSTGRTENIG